MKNTTQVKYIITINRRTFVFTAMQLSKVFNIQQALARTSEVKKYAKI
ncbi:MAG: hypothetical protein ACTSU7_11325 [Candidatus Heimdallarchaeaceae archaeon]